MVREQLNMDVDVTAQDLAALSSADAVAGFLDQLGYDTSKRAALTPQALGLTDSDDAFQNLELLSEDDEGFLRIVFAQVRSITAKARNDLVRTLGRFSQDHLIILTSNFQVIEFVLIDKIKRRRYGPAAMAAYKPVPKVYSVHRKAPSRLDLRIIRRLTFTQHDGLDQFDKLRSVFEAAVYTGQYYQNRALFADHYLNARLQESPTWAESPNAAFLAVRDICASARERFSGKDEATARQELIEPLFKALGFKYTKGKGAKDGAPTADYILKSADGGVLTVALVYQWDRWLDGPDPADQQTPDENPGASVVSVLERGNVEWVIVTNGKHWRLYSRQAHSRSTNFYEVDLAEALIVSAETDPAEAFRYWWLFFRPEAFAPVDADGKCWLDTVAAGSREYAKQVEKRLKKRVFEYIVPHLAMGFLIDRKMRLGLTKAPTEAELEEIREGSLSLLYRLLFLLYAESRDLLPVRESPYFEKSVRKLQQEIADAAGPAEDAVDEKLWAAYKSDRTDLYDRLAELCAAMDSGDPALNVPTYNGGLFLTTPAVGDESREARIAHFLGDHKLPDLYLAQAVDHLSRDPDEKTFEMVFIDYKSLGVRQLGSIYEGLMEFRLKVAAEDLTTIKQKGKEKVIPLAQAKGRKRAEIVVRTGEVYLANDKGERKATGSYYTPDHIVAYIVDNAVGPVLAEKLEALRPSLREAEKTFNRWLCNAENSPDLISDDTDPREFAAEKPYAQHRDLVEKLFDCKVLDPAMGSGHFLVETVDYITDKLLDFLNRFPRNPVATALEHTRCSILESLTDQGVAVDPDKLTDVHLLKRHVLKRCIYGVDLNPMAVELAKVSLWLDAFTLGAPLSFLDHHLRCGNSLIGEMDLSQHILSGSRREGEMLRAVTEMLAIGRSADARVEDVKSSQALFADIESIERPFRQRLNVDTASHFIEIKNVDTAGGFAFHEDFDPDNPPDGRERSARDFIAAQHVAEERRFFHWPLEFPEVFFGIREGTQQQMETRMPPVGGFDAIVGNPPYDELSEHAAGHELPEMAYFRRESLYKDALGGRLNLFRLFIVRAISVLATPGRHSFIVPMSLMADSFTSAVRKRILNDGLLRLVCAFPQKDDPHRRVFFDAKLSTCLYVVEQPCEEDARIIIRTYPANTFHDTPKECSLTIGDIHALDADMLSLPSISMRDIDRWRTILAHPRTACWRDVAKCYLGELMTNASNAHLTSSEPVGPRLLRGANINFYVLRDEPKQGQPLYLREQQYLDQYHNDIRSTHHESFRVGFQESCPIDNWRRLIGCIIPPGHYCVHKIRYFAPDSRYDLYAILAMFNSNMADWRFSITSTNNSLGGYEIDALPIPRFERLKVESPRMIPVEWKRWDALLANAKDDDSITQWEQATLAEMKTPAEANAWSDTIHDALATAGKEMSRLGEQRQQLTNAFSDWLVEHLGIDLDRFSGITHIRGGQADLDEMGWGPFLDMLNRNRRACRNDVDKLVDHIRRQYDTTAEGLTANRERFSALDAAINRIVWQLVGLASDGGLPRTNKPCQ